MDCTKELEVQCDQNDQCNFLSFDYKFHSLNLGQMRLLLMMDLLMILELDSLSHRKLLNELLVLLIFEKFLLVCKNRILLCLIHRKLYCLFESFFEDENKLLN